MIAAQAAHSVEECVFRLYEVFPPSRYVASLISDDPARGFAIGNVIIVLLGVWSYLGSVRRGRPSAPGLAWFWALLELANGIGHSLFALQAGAYFPGVATAPFLIAISAYLIARLSTASQSTPPSRP